MKSPARNRRPADSRGVTRARGFSLIELMIVLGLISILAALGYPSYVAYIQRANRAAAKTALEEVAQYMERQFTINNAYPTAALPAVYAAAPLHVPAGQQKYDLAREAAASSATTYVLMATPRTAEIDPSCGVLRLDNVGNQRAKGHAIADAVVADDTICWQK